MQTINKPRIHIDVTLKEILRLITCAIKYDYKYYPQIFLEEALCKE